MHGLIDYLPQTDIEEIIVQIVHGLVLGPVRTEKRDYRAHTAQKQEHTGDHIVSGNV